MDVWYRFAGDECVLGAGEHLMAIAGIDDVLDGKGRE